MEAATGKAFWVTSALTGLLLPLRFLALQRYTHFTEGMLKLTMIGLYIVDFQVYFVRGASATVSFQRVVGDGHLLRYTSSLQTAGRIATSCSHCVVGAFKKLYKRKEPNLLPWVSVHGAVCSLRACATYA